MKSTCTTFTVALAMAISLLTVEAYARGSGHSGGHSAGHASGHASGGNHSRSTAKLAGSHVSTVHNVHPGNFSSANKLGQSKTANKLNLNKGLNKNVNKKLAQANYKNFKKKWFPGKSWWGYGFGWGGCYGGDCGWYPGYCYEPWYYSPCYNICGEYYSPECPVCDAVEPGVSPAAGMVRITNPAETQTALSFAVNGQTYSLEAGKTQDIALNSTSVIEFDRGAGNDDPGRYTLSEGAYQFAATPQGWELYRSADVLQANAVAAD